MWSFSLVTGVQSGYYLKTKKPLNRQILLKMMLQQQWLNPKRLDLVALLGGVSGVFKTCNTWTNSTFFHKIQKHYKILYYKFDLNS